MKNDSEKKSKTTSVNRDKEVGDCIAQWADAFGLTDWNISYDFSGQDITSNAEMSVKIIPRSAHITFNKDVKDHTSIVIHELIHLLMADIDDYVKDLINMNIPPSQQDFVHNRYETVSEIFVHRLSQVL